MKTTTLGNRHLMRAINRSVILNIIKNYSPIARAEIARRTGLSPATITGITAVLIKQGLVLEKSYGDSRGGRPPIMLALNPKGGYVVGIKLTEAQAIAALTDVEASIINKKSYDLAGQSPEEVAQELATIVTDLLKHSHIQKHQLLGVGIGVAGVVDGAQGVLRSTPFKDWKNVPLRDLLQKHLRVPIAVENDVNTLTLAELYFGVGQGLDDFLIVTIGRGVGMGLVINGRFYGGSRGGTGEFGHIVIDPNGPGCECGKKGCLEAYVGDHGLLRMNREASERGEMPLVSSVTQLLDLAQKGNPAGRAIYARAGEILGLGIANLINILNPQKIIISGEGVVAGDLLFEPMQAVVKQNIMPGLEGDVEIQIDAWGNDAWARGAASLVLHELFRSPIHPEVETISTHGN